MSTVVEPSADRAPAPTASSVPSQGHITPADMHDIQGNVVRGYRMPNARHFALRVGNGATARRFIAAIVPGSEGDGPFVTTATDWGDKKPDYCLNIGITWNGLRALGLPASVLSLFPATFRNGPQGNAKAMGDEGASAPEHWTMGGPSTPQVHVLLSLFSNEAVHPCMDKWSAVLEAMFARDGLEQVWRMDAATLPDGKVHFGYKDGIAQPRIKGVPGKQAPDMQPEAEPGEFLLGRHYVNQYAGNFIGALPPQLADNATYGAFRVLAQDVDGFENFIRTAGKRYNMSPELVAAKLMGRWRNGVPLVLSPDAPQPPHHHVADQQINNFDFAPSASHPTYYDDAEGLRCPVGAHIRRLNPRNSLVMGKPHTRRLIRRGMAYGPAYEAGSPDNPPGERGLVGYFICGDLDMQFEFMLSTWVNADFSTTGIRGTREPLLGAQPEYGGQFVLRTNDARDPIVFDNLPRLIQTRGSVYCLLPGIGGLRFLAGI
jgi:deferrochelatase/peroxidase EfeB